MPFYTNGDVRIHYEEVGSGFPLLVTPGGGLNSVISGWPNQVFNAMEVFKPTTSAASLWTSATPPVDSPAARCRSRTRGARSRTTSLA